MILRNVFSSRTKISRPRFNVSTDRPVQSGLGVTPSQMLELTPARVPNLMMVTNSKGCARCGT